MVNSAMEIYHNEEQDYRCVHLELELGLNAKWKRVSDKIGPLYPEMFKDDCMTFGRLVKARGEVLKQYAIGTSKAPNLTCRIESFGRICQKFDGRRRRWVTKMGFGGLLHLAALGMQLPRQLAYWLLTRVDPVSKTLISPDGKEFSLSPNQVYWVLGIPNGGKPVPTKKNMTSEIKDRVDALLREYGSSWETRCSRYEGRVYISKGISVNHMVMERLEGEWNDGEEAEFKTLFLLLSLHMVLCPTQSPRISADLVPALTYAQECIDFDWCGLVVSKLLCSVATFARTFYDNGYARGSG
ncbi:uncharacterized protein LOC110682806 [Chenopodium quinoa]|uniref:uncharacterized protein LOC110682806 n=1 Tax=Chenopodium quinoa TaxID=63459 RepID=UPI000B783501|nr:uncharacterized protein LOC110682806 [Chenopodium quinoa]